MQDGVNFTFGLEQMFWFHCFWFSDSWKQRAVLNSIVPFSLLFQQSCFYNQDVWRVLSWQLEAPGPSTKAKMFNAAVWEKMLWKDMHNGECIPNVFLWAPVCMSCLFAMLPRTTEKAFSLVGYWSKTGRFSAQWKRTHWLSRRIFSKAERLCNCQQYGAKNIINFWIHPGTISLWTHNGFLPRDWTQTCAHTEIL